MASVIGTIFFFVIAMTLISFSYEVAQNQIVMQQADAQKVTENLDAELLVLPGGHMLVKMKNNGFLPSKLTRIWVIDKTTNNHVTYPNDLSASLDIDVPPWESYELRSDNQAQPLYAQWVSLVENRDYSIRMVTERGNIIEPKPFTAVSGQTVTIVAYPPWVSTVASSISTNASETPVPQISKNPNNVAAYDGAKVYLSIKNPTQVTFFMTFNSKVIFKKTTGTPQLTYANRLSWYGKYTYTGTNWQIQDSGSIDQNHDSKAIYPGEVIVVEFETPQQSPGTGPNIPSGTYQVYLHLAGYDATGKAFFQDLYYGSVTF